MRVSRHLPAVLVVGLLLAGCTGDGPEALPTDDPATGDAAVAGQATFIATGIQPFEGPAVVDGGEVTITFVNEDGMGHNLTIEELGEATATIGGGEQQQLTVELEPGQTYTLFCSVPGHRAGGMEVEISAG